jgi:hypothetical protein
VRGFVPESALVIMSAIVGVAQVDMIEVQPSGLLVMIGRSVQVRRAGYEAKRQIEGTTTQGEDPTHPSESNRIHGAVLFRQRKRTSIGQWLRLRPRERASQSPCS